LGAEGTALIKAIYDEATDTRYTVAGSDGALLFAAVVQAGTYIDSINDTSWSDPTEDTTFVVDNGSLFSLGNVIQVVGSSELMRVTDITDNTLTVLRGYGNTTKEALADNQQLNLIPSGVFYDEAPPSTEMPYIVYKIASKALDHNFCGYLVNAAVTFNIYDSNSSVANVCAIKDKLTTVFDRAVLNYSGKTAIGCLRMNDLGPQTLEDGWMSTVTYNISYE